MATCTVLEHLQVGAHIAKNALSYPRKLVAKNAGVNGSVVSEKILSSDNPRMDTMLLLGTMKIY
ncbi:hypothetical protein SAY87_016169 [Trapa incisa]|uniref:Uncharacterized protein n=1 Tax=Trapa incisa TaxID=236973 RepID=A0AAN7QYS6_9MYRT|nr:hypothetical protein SAY87_016169 [Trapa incisa]